MAEKKPATSDPAFIRDLGSDTDPAIATKWGVSASRVRQLRESKGIPAFRAVRAEAVEARIGRDSDKLISETTGMDRAAIRKRRQRAGIESPYNVGVAEREARIRAYVEANPTASVRAVATACGCGTNPVMRIRKALGLSE